MNGVTLGEQDHLHNDELLMYVMETRERIDDATTPQELASIADENQLAVDRSVKSLEKLYAQLQNNRSNTMASLLDTIKDETIRLRYLYNINAALRERHQ